MGNSLSSNNDLFKQLNNSIMKDTGLKNIGEATIVNQKKQLKKLFTEVSENNATADDKKALEARITVLKGKVEELEAKMASLEEQLAEKQEKVSKHAKIITDYVKQAEGLSETLADDQKEAMERAYSDVMYDYKKGLIGSKEIVSEYSKRVANMGLGSAASSIEKIASRIQEKRTELQPLIDETTGIVDQVTALENQYGLTKSSYNLLNATLNQVGATETTYTNSDVGTSSPIFSVGKLEVISSLTEDPALNVVATNTNFANGVEPEDNSLSIDQISEKYKDYMNIAKTSGCDSYSYDNAAVQKLGEAIDNGLLEDLAASGLPKEDLVNFLSSNFSAANITKNGNGSLTIPYGHYSTEEQKAGNSIVSDKNKACQIYNKLTDFVKNNVESDFLTELNTWDENVGNTISSNAQLEALSNSYSYVIDTLSSNGFTFKEAMYAMFDENIGLFKDCGIKYDLDAQENTACYTIEGGGDKQTADFYSSFSQKVIDVYGVAANSSGASVERSDDPVEVKRTDPVTFRQGNKEYAFVIDRNDDGAFSGANDFVGATGDIYADLKSLDTNNDGKLSGDELKNLKVISTDYKDNMTTEKGREFNGKNYLSSETTQVDYALSNAKALGISKIDLDDVVQNGSTGKYDANNSEIFDDTVTFKMNGKEVTAQRKDDTDEFLNTIYGAAEGKNFNLGFTSSEAGAIIDESYGEFDQMFNSYEDVIGDINVIRGADQLADDTRGLYTETSDSIEDEKNTYLRRVNNAATAEDRNTNWDNIQGQVQSIANRRGISIDMTQAKGLYLLTSATTASDVVDEYEKMIENEKSIAKNQESISIAWEAIILCVRNGIATSAQEILDILNNDKADNADGVVKYLLETKGRTMTSSDVELDLDDERTQEILTAFRATFSENGKSEDVLNALYDLCVAQQDDRSYMSGKSGAELAQQMLKKY